MCCGTHRSRQNGDQRGLEAGGVYSISPPPPDSSPPLEPYDPHQYRKVDAPTNNTETLVHLLKGSLGTGILAMPNAFNNAGLALGFVSTIFIGIMCTYCLHVLIRTQYKMCRSLRVPFISYPHTMEIALEQGPHPLRWAVRFARVVVNFFLVTYQLGICCVYIVFMATNIKDVVDIYWTPLNVRYYMLLILLPLILLNFVRNLKQLTPFSTFANVIIFIGLGVIMYYLFDGIPSPAERVLVGQLRNYPLFIGTTLFALESVGVIIALEHNMLTPVAFSGYTGVLNRGMSIIVFLYVFMGFVGCIRYGDEAKGSVTLNLPIEEKLAQSVKILYVIAISITYALQCYVPVEIIWYNYWKNKMENSSRKKQHFCEYTIRIGLVIGTFLVAVAIPRLELFISLFGALCLSALGIVFPAFIEMCLLWPNNFGRCKWILVKDLFLLLCGLFGLVIGTYTSINDIIASLI